MLSLIHILPHDAARRDAHGISYVENMSRLGLANVRVVPRTTDVWRGINTPVSYTHLDVYKRQVFPPCR